MNARTISDKRRLYDVVSDWAEIQPDAEAWRYRERSATYPELREQIRAFAKALLASGVRKGDRVAMLSTPSPEHWTCFLATASIGAIWVGLNPRYQLGELSYAVEDCAPCILFSIGEFEDRDYRETLEQLSSGSNSVKRSVIVDENSDSLDEFLRGASSVSDETLDRVIRGVDGHEASLIVYTSGTTGAPKGAVLSQFGLCHRFGKTASEVRPRPLRMVSNLPINHVGGIGEHGCMPLMAGGTIIFHDRFNAAAILSAIEEHQLTVVLQIPVMLKLISEQQAFSEADWSSVRLVIWGGGAMSMDVLQRYRALGVPLKGMFGLTEAGTALSFTEDGASDEVLANTTGEPVAEYSVDLRTEDGSSVPIGERGEVVLDNSSIWLGYFNNPEATRAALTEDGLYRTGDIGILRKDGNLSVVGRKKEMYKSGGYNIYPREIELMIESHSDIRSVVVVGRLDADYGEVGVAFVELVPGSELSESQLKTWCHRQMANFKVPKQFNWVVDWPLLPNGKIDRIGLKHRVASEKAGGA